MRVIIVDDEPLARAVLREHLGAHADVDIVGECANGFEAVKAIAELGPEVVFLDIQMPKLDGFEVVELAGAKTHYVFVTAYDQFALRAFDVHALDYLLKPLDEERFRRALERAKAQLKQSRAGETDERLRALLREVGAQRKRIARMTVKSAGRTVILATDEIDYVESAGNYLRLKVGKDAHLIRESLSRLEEKLDPEKFVRIHRSTIVNVDRIKEMHPLFNGDQVITLHDGTRLTMSRTYREKLFSLLE
jgi:two-component system, LytTR family, response regulator